MGCHPVAVDSPGGSVKHIGGDAFWKRTIWIIQSEMLGYYLDGSK
jgi:hypothetical protein